jgi:hypothetical protein
MQCTLSAFPMHLRFKVRILAINMIQHEEAKEFHKETSVVG